MSATLHTLALPAEYDMHEHNCDVQRLVVDPNELIKFGDLVHFPEQQTGAGDYEGLFAAMEIKDGLVSLSEASDMETLMFPAELSLLMNDLGTSFREYYHESLSSILNYEESLQDCFGDADEATAFWESDDMLGGLASERTYSAVWHVPYVAYVVE